MNGDETKPKPDFAASFKKVMDARKAITDKEGNKRGVVGEIDCPVCKNGKLRYSIAGVNGHIHANCTTAECVRWME